jgi:hypothetical protein
VDICVWLVDYGSLYLLEWEGLAMLAITGEVIPVCLTILINMW